MAALMSIYLGSRQGSGVKNINNPVFPGCWVVQFDPQTIGVPQGFDVWHMALKGPLSSSLQVYQETTFFSNVVRGDINDWDPQQTLRMMPGESLFFYWNTATGSAPFVSIWIRLPVL